ncbi:DUF4346 domain-containing protein [Candidatus Woesearchaeota archaeon]|nr:DUF4346 domain-containing protein [Candidatus Woesearchaeota archaeon]
MDKEKLKQEIEKGKRWVAQKKQIIHAKDFKIIQGHYHEVRDFVLDKNGFFLIRVYNNTNEIGAAFVDNETYEMKFEVRGKTAQEVYHVIFNELNVNVRLDHAAYLGKELKKAEMALEKREEYLQE